MDTRKNNKGGRTKGSENKSTAIIKQLVQSNVDFPKLIKKLSIRAMKNDTQAAKILFEYGFGKAPQPLEHSGEITLPIKFVEDLN
jgi:hypothetical protein